MFVLIETHNENNVEWGIGFNSPNPTKENYFQMIDKETATRLMKLLDQLYSPQSLGTIQAGVQECTPDLEAQWYMIFEFNNRWLADAFVSHLGKIKK